MGQIGARLAVVAALAVLVLAGGAAADASWTATVNGTEVTVTYEGSGTEGNPYVINGTNEEMLAELQAIDRNQTTLDYHYELANDIDASDTANWVNGGFDPIGNSSHQFGDNSANTFNGNGQTISNLFIQTNNQAGLFGETRNAVISNLTITNVTISGGSNIDYTGAVVGRTRAGTTIENVEVQGNISQTGTGGGPTGGLVGYFQSSTITQSSFTGSIDMDGIVGGIAGNLVGSPSINETYFSGDLAAGSEVFAIGDGSSDATINDSYAKVSIGPDQRFGLSRFGASVSDVYVLLNQDSVPNGTDATDIDSDDAYIIDASGSSRSFGLTPVTVENATAIAAVDAMDFDWGDTWRVTESFPELVAFSDGTEPAAVIIDAQQLTDPADADAGATVTVSVPINNAGGEEGSDEIRLLKSDGTQLDTQNVTVAVNTPQTIDLEWSSAPTDFGDHTLTVASSAQTRTVDVTLNRVNIPPVATNTRCSSPAMRPRRATSPRTSPTRTATRCSRTPRRCGHRCRTPRSPSIPPVRGATPRRRASPAPTASRTM